MVVVMQERATEEQVDAVIARLIELGMDVHRSSGATRTVLGVVGAHKIDPGLIGILDGVHEVLRISEPYKLASRDLQAGGHGGRRWATSGSAATRWSSWPGRARSRAAQVEAAAAAVRRGGREDSSRRRLQAAHFAVQLPGPRRAGLRRCATRPTTHRPAS